MRASIPFVPLSRRAAVLMLVLFLTAVAYAQITPSDDAYVNSAAPTTNYGTAATLIVNSAADTGFIRFDLTAVPSTYTGSQVAKATLKLYVNRSPPPAASTLIWLTAHGPKPRSSTAPSRPSEGRLPPAFRSQPRAREPTWKSTSPLPLLGG